MKLIYENRSKEIILRILVWGFLVLVLAMVYVAWLIVQWYGLLPADGGVLKPLSERLMLAGFLVGLALLMAVGMMIYATLYTLRIVLRGDDDVTVTTISPFATSNIEYRFKSSDFTDSNYYGGLTPMLTLRVSKHRLPFILDLNNPTIDYEALYLMTGGDPEEWDDDE